MIDKDDIAKIVEEYDRLKLRIGMTASHSALDICDGAIEEGFPTVAYCKEGVTKHMQTISRPIEQILVGSSVEWLTKQSLCPRSMM